MSNIIETNNLTSLLERHTPDLYKEFIDKGYLVVHCHFNDLTDSQLKFVTDYLIEQMRLYSKKRMLFDISGEGLPFSICDAIHRVIIPYLKEKYSFTDDDIIFITGLHPIPENFDFYIKHCKQYNWQIIKNSIFNGSYNLDNENKKKLINDILPNICTQPTIKFKKFLSVNRNPRTHRLALLAHLLKNDLLRYSYFSLFNFVNVTNELNRNVEYFVDLDPNNADWMTNILLENKNLLPLKLHDTLAESRYSWHLDDLKYLNEVYFIVNTETTFYKDVKPTSNCSLDSFFFTEKTVKTLCSKKPFLLMTRPHTLRVLKNMGFKSFHPYIDETYDTIEDDVERLNVLISEITRLCKLSTDEWLELEKKLLPIAEYNCNLALNLKKDPKWLQLN